MDKKALEDITQNADFDNLMNYIHTNQPQRPEPPKDENIQKELNKINKEIAKQDLKETLRFWLPVAISIAALIVAILD